MALQITGNVETNLGITLQDAYSRITPILNTNGKTISVHIENYISKETYSQEKVLRDTNLPYFYEMQYNRVDDGVDVLLLSHNYVKEELELLGYIVEILLD